MSTIAIDVTPDLERRLESAAREQGMPLPNYVRSLLEAVVPRRTRKITREELRAAAEAAREYYATDPEALELAEFVGESL